MKSRESSDASGLRLPKYVLGAMRQRGIFAQPSVRVEHQHLARRYVVRGLESGGAVGDVGHYVTFAQKEETNMECDLCKREPSVSGSLLCSICAEAIQRLVAIHRDASATGVESSDSVQPGAHKTTWSAGHRDT